MAKNKIKRGVISDGKFYCNSHCYGIVSNGFHEHVIALSNVKAKLVHTFIGIDKKKQKIKQEIRAQII